MKTLTHTLARIGSLLSLAVFTACGGNSPVTIPPGPESGTDGSFDARKMPDGTLESGREGGPTDTGSNDTSAMEAGPMETGPIETGPTDTGPIDAGCASPADCPLGEACDPKTRDCTTTCSSSQPCNGGCCNAGTCATGTAMTACGATGAACTSCAGKSSGTACLSSGTCGCTGPTDCPTDEACDTTSGVCGTTCSFGEPCNGGCCNGGICAPGTAQAACGAGGGCVSCVGSPLGDQCLAGGNCGCAVASDCPTDQACSVATGTCTSACSPSQPCNGGCCRKTGTCGAGTSKTACGTTGAACISCTGIPTGSACLASGTCGCSVATDCPADQACNVATGTCTTACSSTQPCNGGCCDAGSCVDTNTNPNDCGGCGIKCGASGTCLGGACIDLSSDPDNCGMPGNVCNQDQACISGGCACRPGLTACASPTCPTTGCADLMTDPDNCGTQGHVCSGVTNTCVSGICSAAAACLSPMTRCPDVIPTLGDCVDEQTDPQSCGFCGNACNSDQVCVGGFCQNYSPAVPCSTCPCTECTTGFDACCPSYTGSTTSPQMCVTGGVCP